MRILAHCIEGVAHFQMDGMLTMCFLFLTAIRVMLMGKAHAEWKVVVSGDRRTVKDDQVFIDDRAVIWGKGECCLTFRSTQVIIRN